MNPKPKWKRGLTAKQKIGQKLKTKREGYGLTLVAVAKVIGCHYSSLSLLERGKFGSMELAEAYAEAFGLELNEL